MARLSPRVGTTPRSRSTLRPLRHPAWQACSGAPELRRRQPDRSRALLRVSRRRAAPGRVRRSASAAQRPPRPRPASPNAGRPAPGWGTPEAGPPRSFGVRAPRGRGRRAPPPRPPRPAPPKTPPPIIAAAPRSRSISITTASPTTLSEAGSAGTSAGRAGRGGPGGFAGASGASCGVLRLRRSRCRFFIFGLGLRLGLVLGFGFSGAAIATACSSFGSSGGRTKTVMKRSSSVARKPAGSCSPASGSDNRNPSCSTADSSVTPGSVHRSRGRQKGRSSAGALSRFPVIEPTCPGSLPAPGVSVAWPLLCRGRPAPPPL